MRALIGTQQAEARRILDAIATRVVSPRMPRDGYPLRREPQGYGVSSLGALSAYAGRVYVGAMPVSAGDYRPRDAEHTVLYRVIAEHLEAFLEMARRHADGAPLPDFVKARVQRLPDLRDPGARIRAPAMQRLRDRAAGDVLVERTGL